MSNDIEKDFTAVAEQINDKIKEAAEALKEANKLAKAVGAEYYDDSKTDDFNHYPTVNQAEKTLAGLVNFNPLLNALDDAGWQTSSMTANC